MTEQELRTHLSRSLVGADLPECRKHDILSTLKGEAPMKKHIRISAIVAMAALLAALTATVAVASGLFRGTVNWNAQPTQNVISASALPAPTASPEQSHSPSDTFTPVNTLERITAVQTLLAEEAAAACGDLVLITEKAFQSDATLTGRRIAMSRMVDVADYGELQSLLKDSLLPLPHALPDDYAVTAMQVERNCQTEGCYTLHSVTERTLSLDGSTLFVHRYAADPEHDEITSYCLTLSSITGETIQIIASLTQNSENQDFGLWDDETASPVTVPGMDNALLIRGSARTQLFLRRRLRAPVAIIPLLHPDAPEADSADLLTELFIRISATGLDDTALLALFVE